jgi:hypothetical protein
MVVLLLLGVLLPYSEQAPVPSSVTERKLRLGNGP